MLERYFESKFSNQLHFNSFVCTMFLNTVYTKNQEYGEEDFYKGAEVTEWGCRLWFLNAMEPAKLKIFKVP
jgi:hypothetical protein